MKKETYLKKNYGDPKYSPNHHIEIWEWYSVPKDGESIEEFVFPRAIFGFCVFIFVLMTMMVVFE